MVKAKTEPLPNVKYTIWVSHTEKCLSFHSIPAYQVINFQSEKEMWEQVRNYVDAGYRVG